MAVDASGRLLATASADSTVKVWEMATGSCTHSFTGHRGVVLAALFHPRDLLLFSAGEDSDVRIWDLNTRGCIATMQGHMGPATCLSLSPDGWTLVSGGRDKVAQLWDVRTQQRLATVPVFEAVEGIVALPPSAGLPGVPAAGKAAGKALCFATGGEKGVLKIWRGDTGTCVYEQQGMALVQGGQLTHLALLPQAQGLLVATADNRLLLYEKQEGAPLLKLARQLVGSLDQVTDLRFLGPPAAPTHLAVSTNSELLRVFALADLGCTATLAGHADVVLCLDAAVQATGDGAAGSLLASGGKDRQLRLWDAASGACLGVGEGHIGAVSAVAFSHKSPKWVATGGADKLLKLWDVAAALAAGRGSQAKPTQLKVVAATAAHDKDINTVACSPNDALICTGSQDRTAKVWRTPDLVPLVTLRGHRRGVWAVQFSPIEQAVVTASGDKTLKLWRLADGTCLKTFEGHGASVLRACFLSAGTQLLSSGADGLLRLWSVRTSECLNTFDGHEDKVWALTVGAEREGLAASGSADAIIRIWEDTTAADEAVAAEAEQRAVLKQQDLSNALQAQDYRTAAALAFELRQPGRLLSVVQKAQDQGLAACQAILRSLAGGFDQQQLRAALEYAREWNTNARHCHAAQALLQAILMQHTPERLLAVEGIAGITDALLSYTQRHYTRVDRLVRSSYLLDYTLAAMNVLQADKAAKALEPAADGHAVGPAAGLASGQTAPQKQELAELRVKLPVDGGSSVEPDRSQTGNQEAAVQQQERQAQVRPQAAAAEQPAVELAMKKRKKKKRAKPEIAQANGLAAHATKPKKAKRLKHKAAASAS